jgi:hypothetical protein
MNKKVQEIVSILADADVQPAPGETLESVAEILYDLQYGTTKAVTRRRRGRPRDDRFDVFVAEQYPLRGNAWHVATAAQQRFGGEFESVYRRVQRTPYYRALKMPQSHKAEHESPTSAPSPESPNSPSDRIEQFLRRHGDATSNEIAAVLGLEERFVRQILNHQRDRFQYLPGDRWQLQ